MMYSREDVIKILRDIKKAIIEEIEVSTSYIENKAFDVNDCIDELEELMYNVKRIIEWYEEQGLD